MFFQVVEVRTSHARPKVVKTVDSQTDTHLGSPLSLLVQHYGARALDDEIGLALGDVEVYPELDASWVI